MVDVVHETPSENVDDGRANTKPVAVGVGLVEVFAIGILFTVAMLAVLLTYSTTPAEDLYNVSRSGLAGGAGRVLVYLNYPTALAAIAVLGVIAQQFRAGSGNHSWPSPRGFSWCCVGAALLCGVIAWPGVVDQDDLDAKLANILPAAGVSLAVVLTIFVAKRVGIGRWAPAMAGDRVRVVVSIVLTLISLPWIFAEFGIYIDDIPGLGRFFLSSDLLPPGTTHTAVHLGDHHGTSGFLFALTAIWLSRTLPRSHVSRLRTVLSAYLALLFTYGLGNIVNDGWHEQFVKRGWTDWEVPSVTTPALTMTWGVVLVGAILIEIFWLRPDRHQ